MIARALLLVVATAALAACSEPPQTADAGAKKVDSAGWTVSDRAPASFMAPGWKSGDKAAWEKQLRDRNQAQNDYLR